MATSKRVWWVAAALAMNLGIAHAAVDLGQFIRKEEFNNLKISPSGDYYAATVPLEDKTALVVFRRDGLELSGTFTPGRNAHVSDFEWVNNERILVALAEKFGMLDQPQATGEIYAVNADGKQADLLVGFRVAGSGPGTHIQSKKVEDVAAFLTDALPADDRYAVISVWPLTLQDPFTRAEKLDVRTGRRTPLVRAPVRRASFVTDNNGEVRLALGADVDNASKLYYRAAGANDWQLVNDQDSSGRIEIPLGFSEDGSVAYLQVRGGTGTDSIVAWDPVSGSRTTVLHHPGADPLSIIHRNGTQIPVGAQVMDGRYQNLFFDDASPEARQYRSLEAAFPGHAVRITSSTADGRLVLVKVWSGNSPGDFYLFDTVGKSAAHVMSSSRWIDPEQAATVEPFSFKARDGLLVNGYLTTPRGAGGAGPMVVMPHGGPFGIFDAWQYDRDAQMLAAAGYTVMQVNYRGSGNYGLAFQQAGARQWGGTMQDDLSDATRWAIAQRHADPAKICIYGASYGAYAALMGVAKEPDLYQCAAGYVGVYDLPMMQREDGRQRRSLGNWSRDWVGEDVDALAAASPNRLAGQIRVPVFLAAGGEDETAPVEHTRMMEAALKKSGVPVESLYYSTEGHGFYTEPHQREYYGKLLAFLARYLGGETAK